MLQLADTRFFDRAAEHIHLSNEQQKTTPDIHRVGSSASYATARYSAWVAANAHGSAQVMTDQRQATIDHYCEEFRMMFTENYDDYIRNFAKTILPEDKT